MSISNMIYQHVAAKLQYLKTLSDTGVGRGMLANLRRGVGKQPGELPELWGIMFDRIPEELIGKGQPSYAEWAIYTTLTLYAMHQQASEEYVHAEGISIGKAAARLVKSEDDTERILKRMHLVATAVSPNDLAYHLRSVIQLLKGESVPLDYAGLAKELYLFHYPETASEIKITWGRDFYRQINHSDQKENT